MHRYGIQSFCCPSFVNHPHASVVLQSLSHRLASLPAFLPSFLLRSQIPSWTKPLGQLRRGSTQWRPKAQWQKHTLVYLGALSGAQEIRQQMF
ncbi:hypothetical protein IF1G_00290 [Cordyceps javanica]|uniref:Uncharacterized protein n=1 Tax=Cordyceps javanica TaxID=43265 RepID=A0A545VF56_9HYPO|nr:hypothetical protein IF1G_00290 [Cordyceps javanica]